MKKNKKNAVVNGSDLKALKWICRLSKPRLGGLAAVIAINGVTACAGTLTALLTKGLLDNAQSGSRGGVVRYAVLLAVLSAVQIALFVAGKYLGERLRARLDVNFRDRVFSSVLSKKYGEINSFHSGEIVNRMTGDVAVVTEAVSGIPPSLVSIAVRLFCAFTALVIMQWQFAVIFFFGGILIYLATLFLRKKIKQLHREMQKREGLTRSFWQEMFEKMLVVKAFGAEKTAEAKSKALQNDHYEAKIKKSTFAAASSGAAGLVTKVGYIFSLVWCGRGLLYGTMTFGSLTAITSLVSQVQTPFSGLSGIMPRFYAALSSAERLMELEELANEEENTQEANFGSFKELSAENLTFSYDDRRVIDGLSFKIRRGELVSVVGESGVGKSTLFKLLLSIYKCDGRLEFTLDDAVLEAGKTARRLFAYVPQGNLLFSGTLRENLLFLVGDRTDAEIDNALKIACAYEFVYASPAGLDSVLGEGGSGFSEGQIQRIAVARAILSGREILLLDEATSALDEKTEKRLLENIKKLTDKTCIMVTHKPAALDICDKKICL